MIRKILPLIIVLSILTLNNISSMPSTTTVIITLKTPFNHPLDKALVEISYAKKDTVIYQTDDTGKIVLYDIPLSTKIKLKILKWKNITINYQTTFLVLSRFTYRINIVVEKVGIINIKVLDIIGNPIVGAKIKLNDTYFLGHTDTRGIFKLELPEGKYSLQITKNTEKSIISAKVNGNQISDIVIILDSVLIRSDLFMNTGEIVSIVSLIISVMILLFGLYTKFTDRNNKIKTEDSIQ